MEKRRGTWMAHGTPRRVLSKDESLQLDVSRMGDMILNLMCIVGFIFLGLIILHKSFGFANNYTFHVYLAIFLILECTVIAVRSYIYLRKRIRSKLPADRDIEKNKKIVVGTEARPSHLSFSYSSYESMTIMPNKFTSGQEVPVKVHKRNSI